MRFWLDKGCDGFRMDVINCISKSPGLPDAPVTDPQSAFQYGLIHRFNGPNVAEYLHERHEQVLKHYPGKFTVGEAPGIKNAEQALPLMKTVFLQVTHFKPGPFFVKIWLTLQEDALSLRTHVHRPPTWPTMFQLPTVETYRPQRCSRQVQSRSQRPGQFVSRESRSTKNCLTMG